MYLDYLAPGFPQHAHRWIREARVADEVHCPFGRVVMPYDDQRRLLANKDVRVLGVEVLDRAGVHSGPLHDFFTTQLLALDGADHRRLRRLVSAAFTPKAVEPFRGEIRALFDQVISPHVPTKQFDAVDVLAGYPVAAICLIFGAPQSLAPDLLRWVPLILSMFDPELEQRRAAIDDAVVALERALAELVEQRRSDPGPDLISALIAVEEAGDRLTSDEVVMLAAALLIGGTESTRLQLLNLLALCGKYPEQWQRLRDDPLLVESAVEEGLRYQPVPHAAYRRLGADVGDLPAGTDIVCDFLAANRDPAVHQRPDEFDVGRSDSTHLTFGFGAHFCVGAHLARIELTEALSALVERIDRFEVVDVAYPSTASNSWGPSRLVLNTHFDMDGAPAPIPSAGPVPAQE